MGRTKADKKALRAERKEEQKRMNAGWVNVRVSAKEMSDGTVVKHADFCDFDEIG